MKRKAITKIMIVLASLLLFSCDNDNSITQSVITEIDLSKKGLFIEAKNQTHPNYPAANFCLSGDNHNLLIHPGDVIKFSFTRIYTGQKSAYITLPGEDVRELTPSYTQSIEWIVPDNIGSETKVTAESNVENLSEGTKTELRGEVVLIKIQ